MAGAVGGVQVEGLRELNRAFAAVSKDLKKEMQGALKYAAEPVRARAEQLAVANIPTVGKRWFKMRTGATQKLVYMVPASKRRSGTPRPNFGPLLMTKAMEPALDQETREVTERIERFLDFLGDKQGF